MPRFSAFAPLGLMRFGAKEPQAKSIYRALVDGQSKAFDMSHGTEGDAEAYATAMAIARARAANDRAAAQHDPRRAVEMLPALERDYGVVPEPGASIVARQRALSVRIAISGGPREESIENGLRTLLGDDFLAYRVTSVGAARAWPADSSAGPGVFARDDFPAKLFRITSTITVVGSAVAFTYAVIGIDDGVRLSPGDVMCVDPGNRAQAEKVTIASADGLTARATFTKAHGAGDMLTTGPVPFWLSTKRRVFIAVSDAAFGDRETRRKIHDFMRRISRGVTTWAIVRRSSPTTIGPFLAGMHAGSATCGTVSLP